MMESTDTIALLLQYGNLLVETIRLAEGKTCDQPDCSFAATRKITSECCIPLNHVDGYSCDAHADAVVQSVEDRQTKELEAFCAARPHQYPDGFKPIDAVEVPAEQKLRTFPMTNAETVRSLTSILRRVQTTLRARGELR